jgi:hypothetical protein
LLLELWTLNEAEGTQTGLLRRHYKREWFNEGYGEEGMVCVAYRDSTATALSESPNNVSGLEMLTTGETCGWRT